MKKLVAALALLAGCAQTPKMVEGTSLTLGAYVPWESNLYGVELVSYVNGCVVKAPSNQTYTVERTYAATNSWGWGLVHSVESSNTKVKFEK